MIKFGNGEPFIKPKHIKFREGQDPNIRLPKVAIGVFSRHLFQDIIEKFSCKEVGYISCTNWEKRSLDGLNNFEKKQKVAILAMELGKIMSE